MDHEYQHEERAIATPRLTKEVIRRHGLSLKKSLGQNFLIDQNILQRIVAAAQLTSNSAVLEVGPGIGALTERLAAAAARVVAVEIDQRLIPILAELLAAYEHVTIIHGDILKLDLTALYDQHFAPYGEVSVVANLPYYITTPIIMALLEHKLAFQHIVVMIQKEVAERIMAHPGGKDYGSLSIAVQYYSDAELVMTVPRTVFIPQPQVDSAVIRLSPRKQPLVHVVDEAHFFSVVRAAFAQRRKTIFNNLSQAFFAKEDKEKLRPILAQCGIAAERRGETVSIEEFAALSNALHQLGYRTIR